jgi:exopolysaccharide biosynthesis polyprenyl glycosylphosphotransferase
MVRIFNQVVSLKTVVLVHAEAMVILGSFIAAGKLWIWNRAHAPWPFFFGQCVIQIVLLQACFYYSGLYNVRHADVGMFGRLLRALGASWLILTAVNYRVPTLLYYQRVINLALIFTLIGVLVTRLVLDLIWLAAAPTQNLIVVGTGPVAAALEQEIRRRDDLNLNICAFATEDPATHGASSEFLGRPLVRLRNIAGGAPGLRASQVVVAVEHGDDLPSAELMELRRSGINVDSAHEVLAALSGRIRLDAIFVNQVNFRGFELSNFTRLWKRALDLFFAAIGILLAAPLMILTALVVWLDSGRPILYKQTRVGLDGKEFQLFKFRSMRVGAEPDGEAVWAALNDPRVTRVGAFLRAYRLDEFPQLFNVVRGEMSLIGPRPERPSFVAYLRSHVSYYDQRHSVRPGVSGWAQVEYGYARTAADAARKLEYDLFYLKNVSFAFDCLIALKTFRIVLRGSGT